jgi:hypothetical protein
MNHHKVCADGAARICMCPEALQLRMVPISSCLPTQYSPRQECFPPQRDQSLRIKVLRMDRPESHVTQWCLTMRLSDAGLRCRPTKLIYPNHLFPPSLTEDATRDRSNRLLELIWSALRPGASQHTSPRRRQEDRKWPRPVSAKDRWHITAVVEAGMR